MVALAPGSQGKPGGEVIETSWASCCRDGIYDHSGTSAWRLWVSPEGSGMLGQLLDQTCEHTVCEGTRGGQQSSMPVRSQRL